MDSHRKNRLCDHAGCQKEGLYRAPRSVDCMNEYYWFCLEHVRYYNAQWNYGKDWTPEQIEQKIRHDALWERQTRPLGGRIPVEDVLRQRAQRMRRGDASSSRRQQECALQLPPHLSHETREAFILFSLPYPPDGALLRQRYLSLVKAYHPDGKRGDARMEEKLKRVTHAYAVVKKFIDPVGK